MRRALIAIAVFVAVVVGCCYLALSMWASSLPKGATIRLRATATILVDGVERTGSSVQEYRLQWNYQPQLGNNGAWWLVARGEGVRIEVPGGEPVFVQLAAGTVFNNCADRINGQDAIRASLVGMDRCDVQFFPTAIRFVSDDRTTAEAVYTSRADRNGYRFLAMTFERTDSPVTVGSIPQPLSKDPKGLISLPFDGKVQILGNSDFSSESFR